LGAKAGLNKEALLEASVRQGEYSFSTNLACDVLVGEGLMKKGKTVTKGRIINIHYHEHV
jgi:hypothetical protein